MEIAGFVSIGALIIVQLVSFAYGYGQLNQKMHNVDKRLNDLSHRFDKMEERVRTLEVKT